MSQADDAFGSAGGEDITINEEFAETVELITLTPQSADRRLCTNRALGARHPAKGLYQSRRLMR